MKKTAIITIIASGIVCSGASAAVLSSFNFTSDSLAVTSELYAGSTSVISFNASPTNFSVTPASEELTFTATGAAGYGGFLGETRNSFQFTYTVMGLAAGESLDITSLGFDLPTIAGGTRIASRVSGGTWGNTTPTVGSNTEPIAGAPTGLVNGDTVTIDFGIRDASTSTRTLDNFTLNGTVNAVPEPTSGALLGLGALGLLARRKR